MACENCKFWEPVFAPYAKKMVMCCTAPKEGETGGCKYFQRKLPEKPSTAIFRYREDRK